MSEQSDDCPSGSFQKMTDPYDPHPGVECCPCAERLRAQNKASSDEWTKRTAKMQSDLIGISAYGQAALAAALKVADEAEGRAEAMEQQMLRERRHRIAAERDLERLRDQVFKAKNNGREVQADG